MHCSLTALALILLMVAAIKGCSELSHIMSGFPHIKVKTHEDVSLLNAIWLCVVTENQQSRS